MAMSEDHGNNLQTVQLLLKKNQVSCPFCPFQSFLPFNMECIKALGPDPV